jgi:hypothetical protein
MVMRYDICQKHTPIASWNGGLAVKELVTQLRDTAVVRPYTSVFFRIFQSGSITDDKDILSPSLKLLGYV